MTAWPSGLGLMKIVGGTATPKIAVVRDSAILVAYRKVGVIIDGKSLSQTPY